MKFAVLFTFALISTSVAQAQSQRLLSCQGFKGANYITFDQVAEDEAIFTESAPMGEMLPAFSETRRYEMTFEGQISIPEVPLFRGVVTNVLFAGSGSISYDLMIDIMKPNAPSTLTFKTSTFDETTGVNVESTETVNLSCR